ncbi:MAG: beta-ketoacyl-[acyl-carrier-protein] synthase family protein [Planctomycetes bacterium]|nr:beta-ketoacyl-[acyl-carrier-protein] synthase family protein [Planctomycetota bacterium]MCB9872116.1 beta-ketoacyl-[acyl-carrier-protein] synthase family protein [Planctomycetota bacterium]
MTERSVVVTGVGVVSALGLDHGAFWSALREGRSGIAELRGVDPEQVGFRYGAQLPEFVPAEILPDKEDQTLDRCVQVGLLPAREAVADAGLTFDAELGARAAVVTGCAVGGKLTEDGEFRKLYAENKKRFHPLTVPRVMGNAGASRISLEFGITGPVFNLSTACSSANHAIGHAFWLVRSGAVDVALAGGHEAFFCLGHLKAWDALRVVAPDTIRPFCRDRSGMILGEGGAMLVLETREAAQRRGARIYAELAGFGMTSDAHHLTMPSVDGPARAIAAALHDARLEPEQVGYINAHGTGTPANDPNETKAIRAVFGAHADRLAVSSTKSMHGHALGAAGALEGVATVLALHHGVLPPTANFTEADPECDLDYLPNRARAQQVEAALSNSFAFGGLNAVLAFRRA